MSKVMNDIDSNHSLTSKQQFFEYITQATKSFSVDELLKLNRTKFIEKYNQTSSTPLSRATSFRYFREYLDIKLKGQQKAVEDTQSDH